MNSFTHTFKIYYLALYRDYLILLFLRSQKQELCTQPLAFERILIYTTQEGLYGLAVDCP